jgi:two-component system sensor histidine kinase DesK
MRLRLLPDSPLGWTPYAWLVYLSFFVVYGLGVNRTAAAWALDGGALVVFLVLYFRAFWVEPRTMLRIAFAIVALGALVAPHNPGAAVFFIYGAAFLGDASPSPAAAVRWLLIIVGIVAVEAWLVPLKAEAWVPGILVSLLVGGTNIHFAEVRCKDRALARARKAAEHLAVVAERERIARDLHDLLGHTLSVIVIKSELAAKLADRDPSRAIQEIRDVERISRTALQEVRQAVHGYRGERLTDELTKARDALDAAGVAFDIRADPLALDAEREHAVALGLREAITNVIRHAHARTCRVSLTHESGLVRLVVEDDGVGGDHVEGAGLSGMRARLAPVGGTVMWEGRRGTRLTLVVPDRQPAASDSLVLS